MTTLNMENSGDRSNLAWWSDITPSKSTGGFRDDILDTSQNSVEAQGNTNSSLTRDVSPSSLSQDIITNNNTSPVLKSVSPTSPTRDEREDLELSRQGSKGMDYSVVEDNNNDVLAHMIQETRARTKIEERRLGTKLVKEGVAQSMAKSRPKGALGGLHDVVSQPVASISPISTPVVIVVSQQCSPLLREEMSSSHEISSLVDSVHYSEVSDLSDSRHTEARLQNITIPTSSPLLNTSQPLAVVRRDLHSMVDDDDEPENPCRICPIC